MNKEEYFEESIKLSVKNPDINRQEKEALKKLTKTTLDFEKSILDVKDKKIKLLTRALIASLVVASSLSVAILVLAPLKTAVPYLLRVDANTGYVDKLEPYNASKTNVNEAVVRYFISKYVENRESYDWYLIQSMYDFILETSSGREMNAYKTYLSSEYSPLKKLSKSAKIVSRINSITFLNNTTAQIRFTKKFENLDGTPLDNYPTTQWLATLSFDFAKIIKTERERLMNPLGFQVQSYKLDREIK